jgi:excisionase family DNA binding protein
MRYSAGDRRKSFMNADWMTAQQVADWLQIRLATVRRWQWAEGLPSLQVGRLRRYQPTAVLNWLKQRAKRECNPQPADR